MSLTTKYMSLIKRVLPSPLSIAIILTIVTALLAVVFTTAPNHESIWLFVGNAWSLGFWELLEFTMQMLLILILGHTIALSPVITKFIGWLTSYITNNQRAAVLVTVFSILMGYFNWGLGLVFGAILARKVAESAKLKKFDINFPLIAACGYVSMLVWHGGLSGSAPLTVAKAGHSFESLIGVIPITETIFSVGNLICAVLILFLLPLTAYFLSAKTRPTKIQNSLVKPHQNFKKSIKGADRVDHYRWVGLLVGGIILTIWVYQLINTENSFSYINLNSINFMLFGVALITHQSVSSLTKACDMAVKGTSGIIIQFPLYAGIMGIMKYTGLLAIFAVSFTSISTTQTFPFFAYLSSALVNILVPSGGGQWQVQGPILIEAAQRLGVPMHKVVMSLAYGDQLTNMLQPFWALPLLSITGLKAKDILPYSTIFMLVAGVIYLAVLYLF